MSDMSLYRSLLLFTFVNYGCCGRQSSSFKLDRMFADTMLPVAKLEFQSTAHTDALCVRLCAANEACNGVFYHGDNKCAGTNTSSTFATAYSLIGTVYYRRMSIHTATEAPTTTHTLTTMPTTILTTIPTTMSATMPPTTVTTTTMPPTTMPPTTVATTTMPLTTMPPTTVSTTTMPPTTMSTTMPPTIMSTTMPPTTVATTTMPPTTMSTTMPPTTVSTTTMPLTSMSTTMPATTVATTSTATQAPSCSAAAMVDGVADGQMTASSTKTNTPDRGRLGDSKGWDAATLDTSQYIQVDFLSVKTITGVATQGGEDFVEWVITYRVLYSTDCTTFTAIQLLGADRIFDGNINTGSIVTREITPPVQARCVRFNPLTWDTGISMRIEIYGC